MTYKYSVIIPVYNAEKTLTRCVDSLINQNDGYAEIILINDGSRDQSGEICREYASRYDFVKYIEQANAGASAARNAGLDAATGEFITFVDSDDFVLDGYFAALDTSDADFSIFTYKTIRDSGILENQFCQCLKTAKSNNEVVYHVIAERLVGPVTKKFRRSLIEAHRIRFKQDLTIGEDFVFGLEYMLCCQSSQVIDRVLYCVDETGMESITRAAKYDLSQFTIMYRYAFAIAKNCNWPQKDKDQLVRLLDYLYCRTAFARTEYCLREKNEARKKVEYLVTLFMKDYHPDIQPLSKLHSFMRWCVKHKVIPVFVLVGWAHMALQRR